MTEGQIYYIKNNNNIIIYFINSIRASYSYALFKYIESQTSISVIKKAWIDLSKTDYIDSTTLGALIKISNLLRNNNGKLFLCNLSPEMNTMLKGCGIIDYFNVVNYKEITELENKAIQKIEINENELDESFVLDTHHDLVNLVPELREQFETLFNLLENKKIE